MKPERVIRFGAISASVFTNDVETDGGKKTIRNVKLQRRYRNGNGEWKTSSSFTLTDLPTAVAVVAYLRQRRVTTTEAQPAADNSEGASATTPHRTSLLNRQNPLWKDGWAWLLAAILIATGLRVANLNCRPAAQEVVRRVDVSPRV